MRHGAERSNVAYVWPKTLVLPRRPPKLIYLDLNHWINLAKAVSGHADGKDFMPQFDLCLAAVNQDEAVFPLSDTIYYEVNKIRSHRQRRTLRIAMEQLSRFMVVTSRVTIARHEIEAQLDAVADPRDFQIRQVNYLDWGVARAFGVAGGVHIKSKKDGLDVTDQIRYSLPDGPEAFDTALAQAELSLNRSMIEGPTPEEEPRLRELGWNPIGSASRATETGLAERLGTTVLSSLSELSEHLSRKFGGEVEVPFCSGSREDRHHPG